MNGHERCRRRGHHRPSAVWRHLFADIDRILGKSSEDIALGSGFLRQASAFFTPGLLSIGIHRVAHLLYVRGWRWAARFASGVNVCLFKTTISASSCIGKGLFMPHPVGVFFHATAGERLTLYSLCVCGPNEAVGPVDKAPRLGDDVVVGVHASVIGDVGVGDRAKVGFRTSVRSDVADDCIALATRPWASTPAAAPARTEVAPTSSPPPSEGAEAISFAETRRRSRDDRTRLRQHRVAAHLAGVPTLAARLCVSHYRLSRYFFCRRQLFLSRLFHRLNRFLAGADIDPSADLGGGLLIPFPAGVSVAAKAGCDLTIMALASIGPDGPATDLGAPQLGGNVVLNHLSVVAGAVTIGDHVEVTAGCTVTSSVRSGHTVQPPRYRSRREPTRL